MRPSALIAAILHFLDCRGKVHSLATALGVVAYALSIAKEFPLKSTWTSSEHKWNLHIYAPRQSFWYTPRHISAYQSYQCLPHRVHLAWWLSRTVYVPGGLEFEPQRLRGFFGFPGV